jgi:uncharacterized cupin superfamily protein
MPVPTIVNYLEIQEPDNATYPGDTELLSIGAPFARALGLHHLAVHHEVLPPGRRSSYPHAHEAEDEFFFVIEGTPDLWLNGVLHRLKPGDGVGFRAGTGEAHTVINNTTHNVRLLSVGEPSRVHARLHYPLHPGRNEVATSNQRHWVDAPEQTLGPHDGLPDALRKPE